MADALAGRPTGRLYLRDAALPAVGIPDIEAYVAELIDAAPLQMRTAIVCDILKIDALLIGVEGCCFNCLLSHVDVDGVRCDIDLGGSDIGFSAKGISIFSCAGARRALIGVGEAG